MKLLFDKNYKTSYGADLNLKLIETVYVGPQYDSILRHLKIRKTEYSANKPPKKDEISILLDKRDLINLRDFLDEVIGSV
jgi:hypothetical protein